MTDSSQKKRGLWRILSTPVEARFAEPLYLQKIRIHYDMNAAIYADHERGSDRARRYKLHHPRER
jgi:hypothetical protein